MNILRTRNDLQVPIQSLEAVHNGFNPRFAEMIGYLGSTGSNLFVEIGPHPVLTMLAGRDRIIDNEAWQFAQTGRSCSYIYPLGR